MGERLSTVVREISDAEVEREIGELEKQFTATDRNLAQVAILDTMFGDQLMQKADLANMPVATGGPTWKNTGMIQDKSDGDNDFADNRF
jgi:hypothetical protein